MTADDLVCSLLDLSGRKQICLLDSCAVAHLESHLMIAGVKPVETIDISNQNPFESLEIFDRKISQPHLAAIFTISYDFGLKLQNIEPRRRDSSAFAEPDIFLALFDCLIIHDYDTGKTSLTGSEKHFDEIENLLFDCLRRNQNLDEDFREKSLIYSNFSREDYISNVEVIQEFIKGGDTYQTNLTQQIRARLPENLTAQKIFRRLRKSHPAPFAAFIKRENDSVVSISPERFFRVQNQESKVESQKSKVQKRTISTSPIKGTRGRGRTAEEDLFLRNELLNSAKDRAENVMIVDLLRNDLGRICKFGSVAVEKLCDLETHPTLFHLVSTVTGELLENIDYAEIIKAVFPSGSITGAPKISTMRIIDRLETVNRNLSMGAIGYSAQDSEFKLQNQFDMNVAIRTMVVRGGEAVFNVGGGIVSDSVPENEYAESILKARALLNAVNGEIE